MKRSTENIKKTTFILVALLALAAGTVAQSRDGGTASGERPVKAVTPAANVPEAMTKDQADAILTELRQIRQLLEKHQSATVREGSGQSAGPTQLERIQMNVEGAWYSVGRTDAPVTIVEFSDFQCPFCKRFHADVYAELKKNYVDTGKVRFVSRDFPLDFHPFALQAAEAAHCAGDQGKYWEVRDALLTNPNGLDDHVIKTAAKDLSLDMGRFEACLDSHKYKGDIQKDAQEAYTLQINGTPTFVVARTAKDRLEGVRIVGAKPLATFQSAIDGLLKVE